MVEEKTKRYLLENWYSHYRFHFREQEKRHNIRKVVLTTTLSTPHSVSLFASLFSKG